MSWQAIEKAGIGYLQLMPASLYSLTFSEFTTMLHGKRDIDEALNREDWNRTRFLALKLLGVHVKRGKVLKLSDVAVFPWDVKPATAITAEQRKEAFERARALANKKLIKSEPVRISSTGKIV